MSKAFTNEETPDQPLLVPHRAPLPTGIPNYVTRRGLEALHAEQQTLEQERARVQEEVEDEDERARLLGLLHAQLGELEARITSAELVVPGGPDATQVRFGAHLTVQEEDDQPRQYTIVGVDEADAAHGRIAFTAPLARALLGKRVGDAVTVRTPRGEHELSLLEIAYDAE